MLPQFDIKAMLSPADHKSVEKPSWLEKSNVNILQNVLFYIPNMKESQVWNTKKITEMYIFGGNYPFNNTHTHTHSCTINQQNSWKDSQRKDTKLGQKSVKKKKSATWQKHFSLHQILSQITSL